MTDEIKQRIEQISRGEVPIGYKKMQGGIVPDTWIDVPLRNLLDFKNGINAEKEKFGTGIKLISVMDILDSNPITYDSIRGAIDIDENTLENYNVTYGDILFQRSSENFEDAGKSNVYLDKKTATYSGFVIRGKKVAEYEPLYLNGLLKTHSIRKQIVRLSAGSQHINIGQESLATIMLCMPEIIEQQKIAEILSKWDEVVSLQEKLIEKLEFQKKAIMQKFLHPKKGWKKSRLGNCIRVQNGFAFKSDEYCDTGTPVVRISNINAKKIDLSDCVYYSGTNIKDEFRITKGDVLIAMSGATTGKTGMYNYDFDAYVNQRVGKFILINNNYAYDFIKQIFSSKIFEKKLKDLLVAGAQPNISSSDIEDIIFDFPDTHEQIRVAKILSQFDDLYFGENKYLQKLKQQQKAMQRLLLTGIIRV
jgi:type I restriction enzyme S subunit